MKSIKVLDNKIEASDVDPTYMETVTRAITLKGYWIIINKHFGKYSISTNDTDYSQLIPPQHTDTKSECTELLKNFAKEYNLPFVHNGRLEDYRERTNDDES